MMVSIRYSRYKENRQTYTDKYGPDPRPGHEGRSIALCRECGKPRQGRYHVYCSAEHKEKWEHENVPNGWSQMRNRILKRDGNRCKNCGVTKTELDIRGADIRQRIMGKWDYFNLNAMEARAWSGTWERFRLEVDHIKPVRLYPELEYEESNLRTLCHRCHARHGKKPYHGKRHPIALERSTQSRLA